MADFLRHRAFSSSNQLQGQFAECVNQQQLFSRIAELLTVYYSRPYLALKRHNSIPSNYQLIPFTPSCLLGGLNHHQRQPSLQLPVSVS